MAYNLNTAKVGDTVSVARYGSWNVMSQGTYLVVKADKVKVVLQRVSDGYERTFSVRTGLEKSKLKSSYVDRNTFVETVAEMEAREARVNAERARKQAWNNVEAAAKNNNLEALREAVAALEALVA